MFVIRGGCARCCDSIDRRDVLRIGSLAFGLSLAQLTRETTANIRAVDEAPPSFGRARSCIVLHLTGGPPQHATWDPKPDAPAEVRGAFNAIPTTANGVAISELFPEVARVGRHVAILRAVSTGDHAHSSSGYYMLTGRPHQPTNVEGVNPGAPNDAPFLGSIVSATQPGHSPLPASIRLPHHIWNTDGSIWPGQDAGFLGRAADPWLLQARAADGTFALPAEAFAAGTDIRNLDRRRSLRDTLARHAEATLEQLASSGNADANQTRAWEIVASPQARAAFSLDAEPDRVRERFGKSPFGSSVLLARRLIEAGVRLVQVNWFRGPGEPPMNPVWDSHLNEADRLKNHLAPSADRAIGGLIADLDERGLLEETLVVVLAEFGRSPRIDAAGGRGHWGSVFSILLAGGGVKGGTVHGASDKIGGYPKDNPVRPEDLTATLLHCLGIAPETELHDALGRPHPASRGQVIHPLL
jgi:hypothetical protein